MAGIYFHIPYCRQACHYCNFHFATSRRWKNELVAALLKELEWQKDFLKGEPAETIYFGGGTPSLLPVEDISCLLEKISSFYPVTANAEITLEANPDDITEETLAGWKETGINRLSIGIQSFFEDDLRWMNRSHTAEQSFAAISLAKTYFKNITIDLIYGFPLLTDEKWEQNINTALSLDIPHLSCYALTVESGTPLYKLIKNNKSEEISPGKQSEQFLLMIQWLEAAGYEHYEISNFARPGFVSRHNSSYWQRKKYLGIGPSAHSFNGSARQWNISNNNRYIHSVLKGEIPFESEILSPVQQCNEKIMTSLRTMQGLNLDDIETEFRDHIITLSGKYIQAGLMEKKNNYLVLTRKGKLLADGIASALFL